MTHVALIHIRDDQGARSQRYQALLGMLNDAAVQAAAGIPGWTASRHAAVSGSEADLLDAARRADLVVIMGGEDVDPTLYGALDERTHRGAYESVADRRQLAVIRDAAAANRPLLGLCRGHQLINVAFGGTLHQELEGHRAGGADPFVQTRVTADASIAELTEPDVLCTHHQAIDRVGQGLMVVARAADGTVEAVRHERHPILGVQWHPEHPQVARAALTRLMQGLVPSTGVRG